MVADLALARAFPVALERVARIFLGNAATQEAYASAVEAAGFRDVEVVARLDYGRLVFGGIQSFRAAALEDGASDQDIEQLLHDLSSFVIRASKPG